MTEERRLAAIMFTDIVGYTSLMAENETQTLQLLHKNRELHGQLISKYGGSLAKEIGDGYLVSFHASTDAVRCAAELQSAAEKQGIPLKIGIHEGEVVYENGDIFGDGVNIASRIQAHGEPGSILVSSSVYKDISNKPWLKSDSMGLVTLKNVPDPIELFSVRVDPQGQEYAVHERKKDGYLKRIEIRRYSTWILGFIAIGIAVYFVIRKVYTDSTPKIESLAVLPIANLSNDPTQEYFVVGLQDALISQLARTSELRVSGRTSTQSDVIRGKLIPEIAELLDVDALVEASALLAGDSVRIEVQLIRARPVESHLSQWTYIRPLREIRSLNNDVVNSIAREIKGILTPSESQPVNPQAYILCQKGNYYNGKYTEPDHLKALTYFKEALALDSNYAPAYAGMAISYVWLASWWSNISPAEVFPKAELAVEKALKLDPNLPETHLALANMNKLMYWDWNVAESSYKKALQLDPTNSTARIEYANLLTALGKYDEAISLGSKTIEIDPLYAGVYFDQGYALLSAGHYEEGIESFNLGYEFQDPSWKVDILIATFNAYKGDSTGAISILSKYDTLNLTSIASETVGRMGFIYAVFGHRDKAQQILKTLLSWPGEKNLSPVSLAYIYIALDDYAEALTWLEKAYEVRDPSLIWLNVGPMYDPIRKHPGFRAIVKKMKLPEPEERSEIDVYAFMSR